MMLWMLGVVKLEMLNVKGAKRASESGREIKK